jgi:hypothetical protein
MWSLNKKRNWHFDPFKLEMTIFAICNCYPHNTIAEPSRAGPMATFVCGFGSTSEVPQYGHIPYQNHSCHWAAGKAEPPPSCPVTHATTLQYSRWVYKTDKEGCSFQNGSRFMLPKPNRKPNQQQRKIKTSQGDAHPPVEDCHITRAVVRHQTCLRWILSLYARFASRRRLRNTQWVCADNQQIRNVFIPISLHMNSLLRYYKE